MMIIFLFVSFGLSLASKKEPFCAHGNSLNVDFPDGSDKYMCFTFNSTWATFDEAESYCKDMGGHLATVANIFANAYIGESQHVDSFWIGAYQLQTQNSSLWVWKWYDEALNYTYWDQGQPDPTYKCAAMNKSNGLWQSQPCSAQKPFVCQLPRVVDFCDIGWTYYSYSGPYNAYCYRLFSANNTHFADAEASCVNYGGHLVSITADYENVFFRDLVASPSQTLTNTGVWIGYSYPNGWTDQSDVSYTFWYGNSPSPEKPYAVYIPDGTTDYSSYATYWLPVDANTSFSRYLCKKPTTFYSYIMKT